MLLALLAKAARVSATVTGTNQHVTVSRGRCISISEVCDSLLMALSQRNLSLDYNRPPVSRDPPSPKRSSAKDGERRTDAWRVS